RLAGVHLRPLGHLSECRGVGCITSPDALPGEPARDVGHPPRMTSARAVDTAPDTAFALDRAADTARHMCRRSARLVQGTRDGRRGPAMMPRGERAVLALVLVNVVLQV